VVDDDVVVVVEYATNERGLHAPEPG